MNEALEFYKDEPKVWHISGWNYPIDPEGLPDTFLWRAMNCWGWATWADRWQYFQREPENWFGSFQRKKYSDLILIRRITFGARSKVTCKEEYEPGPFFGMRGFLRMMDCV